MRSKRGKVLFLWRKDKLFLLISGFNSTQLHFSVVLTFQMRVRGGTVTKLNWELHSSQKEIIVGGFLNDGYEKNT